MPGNNIGDKGAKAISKMLKVNTTLMSLDLRSRKEEKRKMTEDGIMVNFQVVELEMKE